MSRLLRDLRHVVEADGGSAFSPGALDELRELVHTAVVLGLPQTPHGMSPAAAFLFAKLHGEWLELLAWLDEATSEAARAAELPNENVS